MKRILLLMLFATFMFIANAQRFIHYNPVIIDNNGNRVEFEQESTEVTDLHVVRGYYQEQIPAGSEEWGIVKLKVGTQYKQTVVSAYYDGNQWREFYVPKSVKEISSYADEALRQMFTYTVYLTGYGTVYF